MMTTTPGPRGTMTFVLHTHLPYCRLAGRWPHGEEWFHEAMLECYLPLLGALGRLADSAEGTLGVTINISPILAEQMADPLMLEHFREYANSRIERAAEDLSRFAADGSGRNDTAWFHLQRYETTRDLFDRLGRDLIGPFRRLEDAGKIEIASCAATHAYLPLLNDDDAVRFQIETGVATHERLFGRKPRSFWLPECAYKPGLEDVLSAAGIRVFFAESQMVSGGRARRHATEGAHGPYFGLPESTEPEPERETLGTTFKPYLVADSDVAVLARNERTGQQVWAADWGYPGDQSYREFHKKDDTSGLHYWRVTGAGVELEDKASYDPQVAAAAVAGHAEHFVTVVEREFDAYTRGSGEAGSIVAAYDTELFGHWWLEGVSWLEQVIARLAATPDVELITAGNLVASRPPSEHIDLPEGSWGASGDHRTWLNPQTEWTWADVRTRQSRAKHLLTEDTEATRQLARELLLLQSSDWQFLITTGQASDYATERFREHCERFDRIAHAIEGADEQLEAIVDTIGAVDNPFADIQPLAYAEGPSQ